MNSKKTIFLSSILCIFAYSLLVFLFKFEKNINFWIIYISEIISILFATGVLYSSLTRKKIKNIVKTVPLDWIAIEYVILQTFIGIYELSTRDNFRNSLLINSIILGVNCIALAIVSTEKNAIDKNEIKVTEKRLFMDSLKDKLAEISINAQNNDVKEKINELEEIVKYSDPMSSSSLTEIEEDIDIKVKILKDQINNSENDVIFNTIEQIKKLILERNRKTKLYKNKSDKEAIENDIIDNRKIIIFIISIVVILTLGIISYYTIILPSSIYNTAEQLLINGKYIEASEKFESLNGYKDSKYKSNLALYEYGEYLLKNKNYNEAIKTFLIINDFKDSEIKVKEIKYQNAKECLDNKEYTKAIEIFKTIKDYQDSSEKLNEAIYNEAEELLENKKYSQAAKKYLSISNYKNSKEKVLEIYNMLGKDDVIYLGQYKGKPIGWQVIETMEHKVLLVASKTIDEMPYNREFKSIEWEESDIRNWLNRDFYNSFDQEEKNKIIKKGNDKVFLLTKDEFKKYKKIKNISTAWWLASNGNENTKASFVDDKGKLNTKGDLVTKLHGIRPAFWLSID